ncbi:hypothetical protein [uncultured Desulfuromonas sp.]|uniref:tetratricopeptide repeat protein n=1 Tax=uncultured Desulfuromonas sp. TaxID=181013 RepID=UPI002629D56C|nr:hypothetical protein [uncultured Desulfuromonas sp.]
MFTLAISLLLAAAVAAGLTFAAWMNILYVSMIAAAVFALCFFLISRIVMKKFSALMEEAQRDLQASRFDKAVKVMESGFRFSGWQFFVKQNLNAQIGTIYYLKRDFAKAFGYLDKGFVRNWVAMGMLGICYMKRQKPGKMIDTFEKACSASKKEPLLWNLYAYCLEKVGERDKAVAAMEKGAKKVGSNEALLANLEALKEGRKMKMKAYGDLWYQFHLEKPGALIKQQTRAVQGRRKIVRR